MTGEARRAAVVSEIVNRTGIDEAMIARLVHGFYDKVRQDPLLGPVFATRIADWGPHLEQMCAFWSSLLLKTRRYQGRPLSPHLRIPELSDTHFQRWLSLFRATAARVFNAEDAAAITAVAEKIAQSFRLSIAFQRGEDTTRLVPLSAGA